MANLGEKNTNSSQFYITSAKCPWLDGMHVVFGEVVDGKNVVDNIQKLGTSDGKVIQRITITNCGELNPTRDEELHNFDYQGPNIKRPFSNKDVMD